MLICACSAPVRQQWQIEALWRFQIPDDIAERWNYPQLTEWDKRNILGLNSARLYGLYGRQAVPVGEPGSAYRTGRLPDYAAHMQPGSRIDTVSASAGCARLSSIGSPRRGCPEFLERAPPLHAMMPSRGTAALGGTACSSACTRWASAQALIPR